MKPTPPVPRRILMTADTVGGVWTYALELARALAPHGIEVVLATMGRPVTPAQWREVRKLDNVEVSESSYKLEWMEEPWADVEAAGHWLLELADRIKPDVVHLNGYAHAALPWPAPTLVVAHSCVLSWWRAVHGTDAPANWQRYREAVTAGLQAAEVVVAPSQAMLTALFAHYGPCQAGQVIANGRHFTLSPREPKQQVILAAGRLWDAAKNIGTLASIAPELPWPVYVAGEEHRSADASSASSYCRSGSGRGVRAPVVSLGLLSFEELLPWFERASIYALPARYEPFGLSVLEAALAGCALVLGDIPSLREVWGDAALFVPPDQPEQLKRALQELISKPAWRAELSARARCKAASYKPERMAEGYLQAYQSARRASTTAGGSPHHATGAQPSGWRKGREALV